MKKFSVYLVVLAAMLAFPASSNARYDSYISKWVKIAEKYWTTVLPEKKHPCGKPNVEILTYEQEAEMDNMEPKSYPHDAAARGDWPGCNIYLYSSSLDLEYRFYKNDLREWSGEWCKTVIHEYGHNLGFHHWDWRRFKAMKSGDVFIPECYGYPHLMEGRPIHDEVLCPSLKGSRNSKSSKARIRYTCWARES